MSDAISTALSQAINVSGDGLTFTDFLLNAGLLDESEITSYLSKPWKWGGEYVLWCNNGKPSDEGDEGFDALVALIQS